ncbi:hypothetical protein SLE2022_187580 [Rubroshorea leprosula]
MNPMIYSMELLWDQKITLDYVTLVFAVRSKTIRSVELPWDQKTALDYETMVFTIHVRWTIKHHYEFRKSWNVDAPTKRVEFMTLPSSPLLIRLTLLELYS